MITHIHRLGGGWAWVLSKDILLKCRTNDDRNSSAGVSGLCVGIFSSLQGWLCDSVLCALQCAKNSVGSCRQSHGCLYMFSMLFRVTNNVLGLCEEAELESQMFVLAQMFIRIPNVQFSTEPAFLQNPC